MKWRFDPFWEVENDRRTGIRRQGAEAPLRHDRRRAGRVHRRRPPQGHRHGRQGRARLRRILADLREHAGHGRLARSAPRAPLPDVRRDDPGRGRAGRQARFHRHRHDQQRPLPGRQGGPRARLSRRLREAAGHELPRRRRAFLPRPRDGASVLRHLRLLRLPHGQAPPRPHRRRRDRRHPLRQRRVSPGMADDQARGHRPEAGRLAHGPEACRHLQLRRRHRQPHRVHDRLT
jgi:hypothetical protein